MGTPKNTLELPPDYYLHYFRYILDFAGQRYADFADAEARRFEATFRALSYEAQCMYIRIANRKPVFFLPEELQYAEITAPAAALDELCQSKLIERIMPLAISNELLRAEALQSLTKVRLEQLCAALDEPPPFAPKKVRKSDLMIFLQNYRGCFRPHFELIRQLAERELAFWTFLFFGNLEQKNMSQFVIRDLGNAQFHDWDETQLTPLAHSAQEAQEHFAVHWNYRHFKQLVQYGVAPQAIFAWFDELPKPAFAFPIFDKFCLRLGEWLEKNKLPNEALSVYRNTEKPPARERCVRILHRQGATEEALALCMAIAAHPQTADEQLFAEDFIRRHTQVKATFRKTVTEQLLNAPAITIEASHKNYVEGGVIRHYRAQGFNAIHCENYVWRGLFGLMLWEVLYDSPQFIHHPLQRHPTDLFHGDFYRHRQEAIHVQLNRFADSAAAWDYAQQCYRQQEGMVNAFIGWHEAFLPLAELYFSRLNWEQIREVLLQIARHPKENARGFPDLLVWNESDFFFVEVKSENDHLAAQQYFWLQFFNRIGIAAQILRVYYAPNTSI
ncbi:VRR-NUC domain-containing protein [Rhodoflexus sp.]